MLTTCFKIDRLPLAVMGVCPLLIVSATTLQAMVMGGVFCVLLITSSLCLSVMRRLVPHKLQLPVVLLLTAFLVNLLELLLSAFYYEWRLLLGIYIPLLAMNCLLMANTMENGLHHGLKNALLTGLSICCVLVMTGFIREVMSGRLFAATGLDIFVTVPGAFFALGLVVALIQFMHIKNGEDCV